jgi:hypothetical protein
MFQLASFARRGKVGVSLNFLVYTSLPMPCHVVPFFDCSTDRDKAAPPGPWCCILPRWHPPSQGPASGLLGQQSDDITEILLALWLVGVVFPSFHHPPNQPRCGTVCCPTFRPSSGRSRRSTPLCSQKRRSTCYRKECCSAAELQPNAASHSLFLVNNTATYCGRSGLHRAAGSRRLPIPVA